VSVECGCGLTDQYRFWGPAVLSGWIHSVNHFSRHRPANPPARSLLPLANYAAWPRDAGGTL